MYKNYKPIINGDVINLKHLLDYIIYNSKSILKICLLINIIFTIYFFTKTPSYTSKVSFYTNYESDIETPSLFNALSATFDNNSGLKFSISNYIHSDKFLDEIIKNEYIVNENKITLLELWGKEYNSFIQINPINSILLLNQYFMYVKNLSDKDKKAFFAKKTLKKKIEVFEDSDSSLHTIQVTVKKYPELSRDIMNKMYKSIINYSNEVTSTKAKEKVKFIENQLVSIGNKLKSSEDEMILFLETNKNLESPSLIIQRDRIASKISLYNQLYMSLSDQLELSRIEQKDNTSSVFLLDIPNLSYEKNGFSLLEGYIIYTLMTFFLTSLIFIYLDRNKLIV